MEQPVVSCRLCGGTSGKVYRVREMMLGTRDVFEYSECRDCGAVQRVVRDLELSTYYPKSYYAFELEQPSVLRRLARRARNWLTLSRRSPLRDLAHRIAPHPTADWIALPNPNPQSRILDVGCGNGRLLQQLADAGFQALTGIDPYLPERVLTPPSVRMMRTSIESLDEEFDLIMFHHSLEHVLDQQGTMTAVARLLAPGGICLIRIPTASSFAWETYREHWYQLDAPRHTVLHSLRSLDTLAASVGLEQEAVTFDSTAWQILWSERYRSDIPLTAGDTFTAAELRATRATAARLNAEGRGDQICAYYRKPRAS
jgi:SAM-dependent methyltransferase